MPRRERQPIKEDPPAGAPAWMLTFCDCMTLLLTFFVLLLSFSSFDESTLKRLEGAMNVRAASAPTISLRRNRLDQSVAVEQMPVIDRTDKGAEKKRSDKQDKIKNPKKVKTPIETDAYHQETILNIPLDRLFWGDSSVLTSEGRGSLNRIVGYLKLKPRYVIIGESSPQRASSRSRGRADAGLKRSWRVLQFLKQARIPPERIWVSGESPRPLHSNKNKPTMQIVLSARDVTRFRTKNKG